MKKEAWLFVVASFLLAVMLLFFRARKNARVAASVGFRIRQSGTWRPTSREIRYAVTEAETAPGVASGSFSLTLSEDYRRVTFSYPGSPYTLEVRPDAIAFNGHRIEVTGDPIVYRIDGSDQRFPITSQGRYMVSEGGGSFVAA